MRFSHTPISLTLIFLLSSQFCNHSNWDFSNRSFLRRLSSMEYQIDNQVVKLEKGTCVKEIVPGAASKLRVNLSEWLALGDLNCDHQSDAVVILTANMGGSGTFYYLIPVIKQREKTVALESILLGDRISMVALDIQDGQITVVYFDRDIGDSMTSSPSVEIQRRFTLSNNTLSML